MVDVERFFMQLGKPSGHGFRMTSELKEYFKKRGVEDFKFATFGLFGRRANFEEGELVELLYKVGVVSSLAGGEILVQALDGRRLFYGDNNQHTLAIDMTRREGKNLYRISKLN